MGVAGPKVADLASPGNTLSAPEMQTLITPPSPHSFGLGLDQRDPHDPSLWILT